MTQSPGSGTHRSAQRYAHPTGLYYLAVTEAWERFSFYGMVALVVLYMVNQLLLPGHAEHVAGLAALRGMLESAGGSMSTQAFASRIFGLYSGLVYFTPLLGGVIADRWIGQRAAVVIGALAMVAGHLAMTFDRTFLVALLLLVIGSGFLKGNIAAQVGALYPRAEEARRARGYLIFSTGINIGSVLGPLLCGYLAQAYGWHYGFGIAAVFMLFGLATYLYGSRHLPARVRRDPRAAAALTRADWRIVAALAVVMLVTIFQSIATFQLYDVMPVWIEQRVASRIGDVDIPVPWYQAWFSLTSILAVPLLFVLWRRRAARGLEPGDLARIGTGAWFAAVSNLVLAAACLVPGNGPLSPIWPLVSVAGFGIGFLYYWPTLLALVSQAAPAGIAATLVSCAYLTLFFSNTLVGWIGAEYERLGEVAFWALHAGIAAGGGLIVMLCGRRLTRILRVT